MVWSQEDINYCDNVSRGVNGRGTVNLFTENFWEFFGYINALGITFPISSEQEFEHCFLECRGLLYPWPVTAPF